MADYEGSESGTNWERDVLEKLALATLQEQRRARHWSIFFKVLWFIFLFALLYLAFGWYEKGETAAAGEHTALVTLDGVIAADSQANADDIISALDDAFKDSGTKGVILDINSPGGSPVQAGEINDEITRLRKRYPKIPIYVVVEDLCASGGYYVAVAADKIFVNKASIVGSIGVIMEGFGFTGLMDKLGIQRRVIAAGKNKAFLDPFSSVDPSQRAYAQHMIDTVHQQFIDVVRKDRGSRLKETPDMFSGLVWSGQKAVDLGLADGFGSIDYVARDVIKAKNIVDYTQRENIAERFARKLGASAAETLLKYSMMHKLNFH
jgi:protease-4